MTNDITFIYYLHKGDNIPFYVGKTVCHNNSRLNDHRRKLQEKVYLERIDEVPTIDWIFWEEYYIYLFKCWGFKLTNKNNGGGGCVTRELSKETREKIGKVHLGKLKPFSEEHRINHKNSYKDRKNKMTWGDKISNSLKGRKITWDLKNVGKKLTPIYQYDLKDNFIKEWEGIKIAELFYNPLSKSNNIGDCCRGKQKTAYGYKWKYK